MFSNFPTCQGKGGGDEGTTPPYEKTIHQVSGRLTVLPGLVMQVGEKMTAKEIFQPRFLLFVGVY